MKLVLVLVVIVVVGVCLGWFHFSSSNDASQSNVGVSVNKDKIEADKDKVVDKMQTCDTRREARPRLRRRKLRQRPTMHRIERLRMAASADATRSAGP